MTFHGVRGSTPCHGAEVARYGGNTSCVSLDLPGEEPVLFDLGTGLRYFGATLPTDRPFRGTCLLSHLHWDHIQGMPFFPPMLRGDAEFTVYAPRQDDGTSAEDVFRDTVRPPLFPVDLLTLPGTLHFRDVLDSEFTIGANGGVSVTSRRIPHVGTTLGFRVEWRGLAIAYLSDHQQPCDGSFSATEGALELCRDADLVIHDAQYTPDEFADKCDWGHCTIDYAVWLAAEAGATRLALFHHDPSHDDDRLDELAAEAALVGERSGLSVFAAREGQTVAVGDPVSTR